MANSLTYKSGIRAGWRGGLVAAGLNTAWLFTVEYTLEIAGLPKGFTLAVVFSSILPQLPGSLLYVWLQNSFQRGKLLYLILAVAFTGFSMFQSFQPQLPDGTPTPDRFALLTIPMNAMAAICGTWFLFRQTETGSVNLV